MPLAAAITGVACFRCGASAVTASRKFCAGVAIRMMSARGRGRDSVGDLDAVVETHAGQPRIGMRRLHLRGAVGVARIEHDIAAGARGDARQRRAPGARADHRDGVVRTAIVKTPPGCWQSPPAPWRWRRAASARAAAASIVSVRPSAIRSAPAQAIIAPLSVQSAGGGMISVVCALAATSCKRAADGLVGGDAAGGDQRAGRAELFVKQSQARRSTGPRSIPAPRPESWRRDR